MNRIKLSLAQKVVTLFFLLCMAFTTIVALQYHKGKTGEVFSTLLPLYGTHLSIILAFYFTSKPEVNCYINPFKFLLASVLILAWNILIFLTIKGARTDFEKFSNDLFRFPEYAGFLIAAAIVWLFGHASHLQE